MECGVTEKDRSLAKDKDLLVSEDGSPVVFVDIKGREEGGRNTREVTVLMSLLYDLVQKGIESTDLQILCFHRHQMDAVKTKIESEPWLQYSSDPVFQRIASTQPTAGSSGSAQSIVFREKRPKSSSS